MAGRIPQSFIDTLLDRVDIVEVIDSRVKLKKSGKNYMACCPFHDEKTPSFSVNAEKQFYHCFGCGESGNAIGFLMAYEHRDFPDVVETLAQQQGMEVPREAGLDDGRQKERQDLYSVLEKANRYYQEQLRSHPQAEIAREYLQHRGLTSQAAHSFGIGYAPSGWDNLLRYFASDNSSDGMSAGELLLRSGMVVEKEATEPVSQAKRYDRFRHRVMFPIRDIRGRVIGFGGRVLNNEDKPKYLNSPETEVFHKGAELYGLYEAIQANRHLDCVLVVEGYMDVVALAQYGISFATATLGTAASEAHLEKAFRYSGEVVFCFDGDEAGRRAARRALEVSLPALKDGRQVRFMFLPESEDPDTLVRKQGKDAFLRRLQEAVPLSEFLFELGGEGLSLLTAEGRSRLVANILPSLQRLPESIYKNQMKQLLASRGQCDVNEINTLLAPVANTPFNSAQGANFARPLNKVEGSAGRDKPSKAAARMSFWDEATGLLLQQPGLLTQYPDNLWAELGAKEADGERFLRCVALLKERPEASLNKLLGLWQSLYGAEDSQHLYALAGRESLLDKEAQTRQLQDIVTRLRQRGPEQRLQALIDKAKNAPLEEEEKQELNHLLREKSLSATVSKPQ
jgi:DNA primase